MYGEYTLNREGAVWNSANEFYRLQYFFLEQMTLGFSKRNFHHAYTYFKELFDYVYPYISEERRKNINMWIKECQSTLDTLSELGNTNQASLLRLKKQNKLFAEMREHKLKLLVSMEKAGLLNWSSKKDNRSIAEKSGK